TGRPALQENSNILVGETAREPVSAAVHVVDLRGAGEIREVADPSYVELEFFQPNFRNVRAALGLVQVKTEFAVEITINFDDRYLANRDGVIVHRRRPGILDRRCICIDSLF